MRNPVRLTVARSLIYTCRTVILMRCTEIIEPHRAEACFRTQRHEVLIITFHPLDIFLCPGVFFLFKDSVILNASIHLKMVF